MLVGPVQTSAKDLEFLLVQFPGMNVQFPDRRSPAQVIHDVVRPLRFVKPRSRRIKETVYHSVGHEGVQREKFFLNPEKIVQSPVAVSHFSLGPAGDRIGKVVIFVFSAHPEDPRVSKPPRAVVYSRRYALVDVWSELPFHIEQRGRFAHVGFRALLFRIKVAVPGASAVEIIEVMLEAFHFVGDYPVLYRFPQILVVFRTGEAHVIVVRGFVAGFGQRFLVVHHGGIGEPEPKARTVGRYQFADFRKPLRETFGIRFIDPVLQKPAVVHHAVVNGSAESPEAAAKLQESVDCVLGGQTVLPEVAPGVVNGHEFRGKNNAPNIIGKDIPSAFYSSADKRTVGSPFAILAEEDGRVLAQSDGVALPCGVEPGRLAAEEPKVVNKDRKPFAAFGNFSGDDPVAKLGVLDDDLVFAEVFHFQIAVNEGLPFQEIVIQPDEKLEIRVIKQEAGLAFPFASFDRITSVWRDYVRRFQAEADLPVGFIPAEFCFQAGLQGKLFSGEEKLFLRLAVHELIGPEIAVRNFQLQFDGVVGDDVDGVFQIRDAALGKRQDEQRANGNGPDHKQDKCSYMAHNQTP